MTQVRSTLYEFLSNMAPEYSKVTLVTFSDEQDQSKPFDLDLKNSTKLYRALEDNVRTARKINNVCLSCGLRKALNVSMKAIQDSSSSMPIIIVIAWKSAMDDENLSGVLENIKNHPKGTTLHLILVEDTTADDISTDIIQAVRSLGGLIYSLPEELVFRASKLLEILSAIVKDPLQIEDRIVVVHKKNYRNISKSFVDSFIIPPGDFSKMLYIMFCSLKDNSILRSINSKCTSLSDASNSDSTFKCGDIWVFDDKKESKSKWEYPFAYLESSNPLHCSSIALLLTSPSVSSTNSFTLKGWLSEYVVKIPQNAVIIYVEITGSPKGKFCVMAQISGPGLESPVSLQLRDNGNGDPDTKAGDGIYSRYFTKFSGKGIYTVSVSAEMSDCDVNSFFAENLKQENKLVQNKTIGFFYVSDTIPELDMLPPNRVADLSVEWINHENRTAELKWTAPGGDYDSGKAKEYEVYYTKDWKDLQGSMLSKIQPNLLNFSEMKSPKSSGQLERVTFHFPVQKQRSIFYVALTAVDISGNKGQLSNMVQIAIGVEKSLMKNITNFNITGDGTETSTEGIHKIILKDEDFSRCYIILGGAIGILLLIIIINIIICLACLRKYKKRWEELQNNSQQSASPLKSNSNLREKNPEDTSTHPHSYTNPIMEEYSNIPSDSKRIRETASFHEPATYALVEKKDRRKERRDDYPLRRVDNINIRPDYPRHRESDLGLV
ncbi:unnamed protein product [Larinioides sclopetarius]|uniref:Uncharacterized protein n=1 Tax=Larinioides sclopetarius TaxID=280406 RepID=A0AAV1ZME5_9ARAC